MAVITYTSVSVALISVCLASHGQHSNACASNPCPKEEECHHSSHTPFYICRCQHNACHHHTDVVTSPPTTAGTTQSASSPTTTLTVPTTVPEPLYFNSCSKFGTINAVATLTTATNVDAYTCPTSGEQNSPDAFVLNFCNVTLPKTWQPGQNVMLSCEHIPLYTPIATFNQGNYVQGVNTAGVLIGCITNGFKIGSQQCDHAPAIEHIEIGANDFYTIQ